MKTMCSIEGCQNEVYKVGMCRSHIARALWDHKNERWIEIYKAIFKTDNRIYLEEDHAVMIIIDRKDSKHRILIDVEDIDTVSKHRWCRGGGGYPISIIDGRHTRLHRYLLDLPDGVLGDHVNGDVFDNRRQNLRGCNFQENSRNRGIMSNNKTGVPGVFHEKKRNKWLAAIGIDRSTRHLGYFSDFNDAVKVRKKAERKYFGEFARQH